MRWSSFLLLVCGIAVGACDKTPEPPVVNPTPPMTINGSERLGWAQSASDAVEVAAFRYAIYVDGTRMDLTGASCARGASAQSFNCSAKLPQISAGSHTLELATLIIDGSTTFESARSGAIHVSVVAAAISGRPGESVGTVATTWPTSRTIVGGDGVQFRLERLAEGVAGPTDLAFMPDGGLLVSEQLGRVRVARQGRLNPQPAWTPDARSAGEEILALAVDPSFNRTHFVYAVSAIVSTGGAKTFTLSRFREAADTLADRIDLLDEIPARSSEPSASLRFGPDGKLFVAFDDGGAAALRGDLASSNGKILRLNPDGTTPDDQAAGSPLFSYPHASPHGLDWQSPNRMLWIADRDSSGSGRLTAVAADEGPRKRGRRRGDLMLPRGTIPSSMAFYRGGSPALNNNLFVASDGGRHLLRIRFDTRDPSRVVSTERLLQDVVGGVRAVAAGPEGAIYIATASAIGRLVPSR